MSVVLGPDKTWPTHKKPHWRAPLNQAWAAGWTLEHIDAPHTFGFIRCPAGQHVFKIDGTARGSEHFATEASKTITGKCRHGTAVGGGKVHQRKEAVDQLFDTVDDLLGAAERTIDALEAVEASWEIVADLEGRAAQLQLQLDTASLTVDDALRSTHEAEEELLEVEAQLDQELGAVAGMDPSPPAEIQASLAEAECVVDRAEDVGAELRRGRAALADQIRKRAAAARDRISILRERLRAAQERHGTADG